MNYRQTRRIADEKLWVESFQKACEMVAKDKASSMQAGGIALLEFLVRNAEPLYWPAIEVLADHLRWTVPNDPKQTLPISHSASAVLNCFGDPSWRRLEDESTFDIDLSKLGIREGWLVDLQFNHFMMHDCVFESTDLTRAWFNDVQFDRTEFINCDFDGCTFVNCQFDGCLFIKPKNLNGTVRKQLEKAACTFH